MEKINISEEERLFWDPNNIEEVDWEEYDRIWESKWKWEVNN